MKKQRIRNYGMRKYKINECLLKRPIGEHRFAVRVIPKLFGISLNTFHNYRNIMLDDIQDIPYELVVMFEQLFSLKRGELINKQIIVRPLEELIRLELDNSK